MTTSPLEPGLGFPRDDEEWTEADELQAEQDAARQEAWEAGLLWNPDDADLVLEAANLEATFAAQRLERVHGMRMRLLARATGNGDGPRDVIERSIRLEIASLLRVTEHAAGRMITHAEALTLRYPAALTSLGHADITVRHAEILVDQLDQLLPELRAQVAPRALELAEAEPVGSFRRALQALIDRVQAPTLEERHQSAVAKRRIWLEKAEDGMGVLSTYAPLVELQAIHHRLTLMAKPIAAHPDETRTLDQVRADVLCDLLVDGVTDAIPAEARGVRASVVVTVPALSLLDDEHAKHADPATVEGIGPIPLSRARELCGGDGSWMRVLTHPETGMVLSVGRDQYRPPAALRKLTKWRSDRCMAPGCGMPASRCEIDHQVAWEHGGETSLQNIAPFCKGHHIIKHHGGWTVRQIDGGGGAIEWISPTGRHYVVKPERRVPVFRPSPPTPADSHALAPF